MLRDSECLMLLKPKVPVLEKDNMLNKYKADLLQYVFLLKS